MFKDWIINKKSEMFSRSIKIDLSILLPSYQHWFFFVVVDYANKSSPLYVFYIKLCMLNHVKIHHEDQMLNCPLIINFEHNVLFVLLLVELKIVYMWINDWNYDQLVLLVPLL